MHFSIEERLLPLQLSRLIKSTRAAMSLIPIPMLRLRARSESCGSKNSLVFRQALLSLNTCDGKITKLSKLISPPRAAFNPIPVFTRPNPNSFLSSLVSRNWRYHEERSCGFTINLSFQVQEGFEYFQHLYCMQELLPTGA